MSITMKLEYVKAISSASLFLLTFLMTMLPMFIFKRRSLRYPPSPEEQSRMNNRQRVVSFLNCFAGGVFLATCLLHLFPDVREQMDKIFDDLKITPNYPVSEFLVGFGFLVILIVEQIVTICQDHHHSTANDHEALVTNQLATSEQSCLLPASEDSSTPSTSYGTLQEPAPQVTFTPRSLPNPSSVLRPILLVLALSFHSIFEGLAIGLQTSFQSELKILFAVAIHKCVFAFSLGLNLNSSQLGDASVIKSNLTFALTSPIGILIGLVVVDCVDGMAMLITSGVLQGLATGTFLYITLFEVLPKELMGNGPDRMCKTAWVVLGYSVVSLLLTFLPE